jgi:hypothetical protein
MSAQPLKRRITLTGRFIAKWIVVILAVVLLTAAAGHRLTLGTTEYAYSPLIYIEIISLLVLVLLIPCYFIASLFFALARNWYDCRITLVNWLIGGAVGYLALITDAPTLIYMT